ncbi:MAG: hypothetical protein II916_06555 [Oscillospiraceae bacterium]|nr:hypothetical protein [Oscillospiraceae bacterium]
MEGLALIGIVMLLGIGGAVVIALLSTSGEQDMDHTEAFAILPVPEDTPKQGHFWNITHRRSCGWTHRSCGVWCW